MMNPPAPSLEVFSHRFRFDPAIHIYRYKFVKGAKQASALRSDRRPAAHGVQVGEPLQLIQKLAGAPAAPLLADLRKMQRSLDAMLQLAVELMQQDLAASLEEILSFLHGWFDFQEQSQIGILVPGNSELDAVKDQYSALPSLLRSVRSAT